MISQTGIGITGLGRGLPRQCVTSPSLAERLSVTEVWISSRTGIRTRYFISGEETAASLSAEAAMQAIRSASLKSQDIDLIIGCTTSGDYVFPAMACRVQSLIGAGHSGAYDISASAAGFQTGLILARDRLVSDPSFKKILVIGTAVQSPFINWNDPKISILLGDASGAAVLERVPEGYGILASEMVSRGELYEAARLRGGGSRHPLREHNISQGLQYIEMDGVTMARQFIKEQPAVIRQTLQKAGLRFEDVDLYIFHQANLRLIHLLMKRMGLPLEKTYTNADRYGNTAEASVPIALYEALEQKKVKRDSIVVLSGVGAGCLFATVVMRWYERNS